MGENRPQVQRPAAMAARRPADPLCQSLIFSAHRGRTRSTWH